MLSKCTIVFGQGGVTVAVAEWPSSEQATAYGMTRYILTSRSQSFAYIFYFLSPLNKSVEMCQIKLSKES